MGTNPSRNKKKGSAGISHAIAKNITQNNVFYNIQSERKDSKSNIDAGSLNKLSLHSLLLKPLNEIKKLKIKNNNYFENEEIRDFSLIQVIIDEGSIDNKRSDLSGNQASDTISMSSIKNKKKFYEKIAYKLIDNQLTHTQSKSTSQFILLEDVMWELIRINIEKPILQARDPELLEHFNPHEIILIENLIKSNLLNNIQLFLKSDFVAYFASKKLSKVYKNKVCKKINGEIETKTPKVESSKVITIIIDLIENDYYMLLAYTTSHLKNNKDKELIESYISLILNGKTTLEEVLKEQNIFKILLHCAEEMDYLDREFIDNSLVNIGRVYYGDIINGVMFADSISLRKITYDSDRMKVKEIINKFYLENFHRLKTILGDNEENFKDYIDLSFKTKLRNNHHLNADEGKVVTVNEIFDSAEKKVLIYGQAGYGKTTLGKKIAYDHVENGLWNDKFEWVIWIPLSRLKHIPKDCNSIWNWLFYQLYFKNYNNQKEGEKNAEILFNIIDKEEEKILFILDEWNELINNNNNNTDAENIINSLLGKRNWLILSRPYYRYAVKPDLIFEINPFSKSQVSKFLNKKLLLKTNRLKPSVLLNPYLYRLGENPLFLRLISNKWQSLNSKSKLTLTELYIEIEESLWSDFLTSIFMKAIDEKDRMHILMNCKSTIINCKSTIKKIAYKNINADSKEFKLNREIKADNTVFDAIQKSPFIITNDMTKASINNEFQFIHETFQEYFAACYIAESFQNNFSENEWNEANTFIKEKLYNPKYKYVIIFIVGLLSINEDKRPLLAFMSQFFDNSYVLLSLFHFQTLLECLEEIHSGSGMLFNHVNEFHERDSIEYKMHDSKEVKPIHPSIDNYINLKEDIIYLWNKTLENHLDKSSESGYYIQAYKKLTQILSIAPYTCERLGIFEAIFDKVFDKKINIKIREFNLDLLIQLRPINVPIKKLIELHKDGSDPLRVKVLSAIQILHLNKYLEETIDILINSCQDVNEEVVNAATHALARVVIERPIYIEKIINKFNRKEFTESNFCNFLKEINPNEIQNECANLLLDILRDNDSLSIQNQVLHILQETSQTIFLSDPYAKLIKISHIVIIKLNTKKVNYLFTTMILNILCQSGSPSVIKLLNSINNNSEKFSISKKKTVNKLKYIITYILDKCNSVNEQESNEALNLVRTSNLHYLFNIIKALNPDQNEIGKFYMEILFKNNTWRCLNRKVKLNNDTPTKVDQICINAKEHNLVEYKVLDPNKQIIKGIIESEIKSELQHNYHNLCKAITEGNIKDISRYLTDMLPWNINTILAILHILKSLCESGILLIQNENEIINLLKVKELESSHSIIQSYIREILGTYTALSSILKMADSISAVNILFNNANSQTKVNIINNLSKNSSYLDENVNYVGKLLLAWAKLEKNFTNVQGPDLNNILKLMDMVCSNDNIDLQLKKELLNIFNDLCKIKNVSYFIKEKDLFTLEDIYVTKIPKINNIKEILIHNKDIALVMLMQYVKDNDINIDIIVLDLITKYSDDEIAIYLLQKLLLVIPQNVIKIIELNLINKEKISNNHKLVNKLFEPFALSLTEMTFSNERVLFNCLLHKDSSNLVNHAILVNLDQLAPRISSVRLAYTLFIIYLPTKNSFIKSVLQKMKLGDLFTLFINPPRHCITNLMPHRAELLDLLIYQFMLKGALYSIDSNKIILSYGYTERMMISIEIKTDYARHSKEMFIDALKQKMAQYLPKLALLQSKEINQNNLLSNESKKLRIPIAREDIFTHGIIYNHKKPIGYSVYHKVPFNKGYYLPRIMPQFVFDKFDFTDEVTVLQIIDIDKGEAINYLDILRNEINYQPEKSTYNLRKDIARDIVNVILYQIKQGSITNHYSDPIYEIITEQYYKYINKPFHSDSKLSDEERWKEIQKTQKDIENRLLEACSSSFACTSYLTTLINEENMLDVEIITLLANKFSKEPVYIWRKSKDDDCLIPEDIIPAEGRAVHLLVLDEPGKFILLGRIKEPNKYCGSIKDQMCSIEILQNLIQEFKPDTINLENYRIVCEYYSLLRCLIKNLNDTADKTKQIIEMEGQFNTLISKIKFLNYSIRLCSTRDEKKYTPQSSNVIHHKLESKPFHEYYDELVKIQSYVISPSTKIITSDISNLLIKIFKWAHEILGSPPDDCEYAVIAFGSIAAGLATPSSDVEFLIFTNKPSPIFRFYFQKFLILVEIMIASFGQTPIKATTQILNAYGLSRYISIIKKGLYIDEQCPPNRNKYIALTPQEFTEKLANEIDNNQEFNYINVASCFPKYLWGGKGKIPDSAENNVYKEYINTIHNQAVKYQGLLKKLIRNGGNNLSILIQNLTEYKSTSGKIRQKRIPTAKKILYYPINYARYILLNFYRLNIIKQDYTSDFNSIIELLKEQVNKNNVRKEFVDILFNQSIEWIAWRFQRDDSDISNIIKRSDIPISKVDSIISSLQFIHASTCKIIIGEEYVAKSPNISSIFQKCLASSSDNIRKDAINRLYKDNPYELVKSLISYIHNKASKVIDEILLLINKDIWIKSIIINLLVEAVTKDLSSNSEINQSLNQLLSQLDLSKYYSIVKETLGKSGRDKKIDIQIADELLRLYKISVSNKELMQLAINIIANCICDAEHSIIQLINQLYEKYPEYTEELPVIPANDTIKLKSSTTSVSNLKNINKGNLDEYKNEIHKIAFNKAENADKFKQTLSDLKEFLLSKNVNEILEFLKKLEKELSENLKMNETILNKNKLGILRVFIKSVSQSILQDDNKSSNTNDNASISKKLPLFSMPTQSASSINTILLFTVDEKKSEQRAWNCFDVAAGLPREKLVNFALEHKQDIKYRKILAPEIRTGAAITAILKNIQDEKESEAKKHAEEVANLFNLLEIARQFSDQDDEEMVITNIYTLLSKQKISSNEHSLVQLALPASMHTREVQKLINNYDKAHENIKPLLAQCNNLLGHPEGKRLSYDALCTFFANSHHRTQHAAAWRKFSVALDIFILPEKALNNYCERQDVYETYIRDYYGQKQWVAFQPISGGKLNSSIIDIAARCLNKQIIIYQVKSNVREEIYRTNFEGEGTIHIQYNGHNHFVSLRPTPEYFKLIESKQPSNDIKQADKKESKGVNKLESEYKPSYASIAKQLASFDSSENKSEKIETKSNNKNKEQKIEGASITHRGMLNGEVFEFIEVKMDGTQNNCGFEALGINRTDLVNTLLAQSKSQTARDVLRPEIEAFLLEKDSIQFLRGQIGEPDYQALSDVQELLLDRTKKQNGLEEQINVIKALLISQQCEFKDDSSTPITERINNLTKLVKENKLSNDKQLAQNLKTCLKEVEFAEKKYTERLLTEDTYKAYTRAYAIDKVRYSLSLGYHAIQLYTKHKPGFRVGVYIWTKVNDKTNEVKCDSMPVSTAERIIHMFHTDKYTHYNMFIIHSRHPATSLQGENKGTQDVNRSSSSSVLHTLEASKREQPSTSNSVSTFPSSRRTV